MGIFVLLIALVFSQIVYADPVQLEKSVSPNGRFYLTINPSPDDRMMTSDMLQIRRVRDKKVLASFVYWQYAARISSTSASSLWKSDSSAFALNHNQGKGWMGSQVYALDGLKWVNVSIPKFKTPYPSEEGWKARSRGHFIATAWLPGNLLRMNHDNDPYRFDSNGRAVLGTGVWVYLELLRGTVGPYLDVVSVDKMKTSDAAEN